MWNEEICHKHPCLAEHAQSLVFTVFSAALHNILHKDVEQQRLSQDHAQKLH